ncbi:DUF2851 family protein [Aquimarina sp. MMG016]|uniref:DUF2851 family protein n=1 Tax=Aquimarina sp. MMG016 TaxID=2822690 RepID=UPI001B3A5E8B|nr:DUF2851 family protein [Aquimarina sp. MMG016]MBQ4822171.1 DUF2851 family protein [Aquimarina sp. MMG016]
MNEDFVQYLWKYKKFELSNLKTTAQEQIVLQQVGVHNIDNSGPDFFNSQMVINNQKWAGNVEVHIKSSDWYVHNHENDPAYDNVILHVVWEDDMDIFRKDNSVIPTLQLKDYVATDLLSKYQKLFRDGNNKWISCDKELPEVSGFVISSWQERLYLERLEQKSMLISGLLKKSANNWEAVLFRLLAKNFGLKVNGEAFLSLADSIDFSIVRKCNNDLNQLEALFFGQAGFLENTSEDNYVRELRQQYGFLQNKFQLKTEGVLPFKFFRLRPPNFPTIRLAQLAMLYFKNQQLFSKIIEINTIQGFYEVFKIQTSDFWQNHYTFEKESKPRKKHITKSFVDLILINTIIPIKFLYAKSIGKDVEDEVLDLISQLPYEKNNIVTGFKNMNVSIENALHSQAMIQLKNNYCDQKACLKCAIGNNLLNQDYILG